MKPHLKYHTTYKGRNLWSVWHDRSGCEWGLDPVCCYGNSPREAYLHYVLNHTMPGKHIGEHMRCWIEEIDEENNRLFARGSSVVHDYGEEWMEFELDRFYDFFQWACRTSLDLGSYFDWYVFVWGEDEDGNSTDGESIFRWRNAGRLLPEEIEEAEQKAKEWAEFFREAADNDEV